MTVWIFTGRCDVVTGVEKGVSGGRVVVREGDVGVKGMISTRVMVGESLGV